MRRSVHWRGLIGAVMALALLGAACSSDDTSDETSTTDDSESSTSTTAEETTTTTAATTASDDTGDTDDGDTDDAEDSEADDEADAAADPGDGTAVTVDLGEWFIGTEATQPAGSLTFSITNSGENPHAFAIVRGDSYETLPQLDNGAVDVDAVGDDFIGATDNIPAGGTGEITFDLEAGNYVFFCPIQFGPNSHAAAGQVLSVTVG